MIVLIGNIFDPENPTVPGQELKERLQSVLDRINRDGKGLISPHTITPQVNFQAVYSRVDPLFDHIWLILYEFYPVKVRFSLGFGEISTEINREEALGMDGPAFQYAREGLERLKKEELIFACEGDPGPCSRLIRHSLRFISDRIVKWDKKRFAVLYGLSRDRSISEMADFLDITERSVYKNIRAGSLNLILETVEEIGRLLSERQEQQK